MTLGYTVKGKQKPMGKVAAAAFLALAGQRRHLSSSSTTRMFQSSIDARVENALRDDCGACGGDVIVTMVSGGCDSVALLHLLMDVKDRWEPSLQIEALHFDHGLREESGADADFVAALCRRVGASYEVQKWKSTDKATQSTSRDWRRREAVRVLGNRAGCVALAHHADDQIETTLLRLARGGRLTRIFRGMETYSAPFVRPLLTTTKAEIIEYLNARDEPWVEDATNADKDKYFRNTVRHKVVPGLQKVARGQLRRRIDALAKQSVAVEEWTRRAADEYEAEMLVGDRDSLEILCERQQWEAVPPPIRFELLARLVRRAGGSAHFASIVELDEALLRPEVHKKTWEMWMPGGVRVNRVGDRLTAFHRRDAIGEKFSSLSPRVVRSVVDVLVTLPGPSWSFEGERGTTSLLKNSVALRGIPVNSRLEVRFRHDGDRFHPSWRDNPIKLKDFLRGQRVPAEERDTVPLLVLLVPSDDGDLDVGDDDDDDNYEERVVAVFLDEIVHVAQPHLRAEVEDEAPEAVLHCRIFSSDRCQI